MGYKMKGSSFYGKKVSYGGESVNSPLKRRDIEVTEYDEDKDERKVIKNLGTRDPKKKNYNPDIDKDVRKVKAKRTKADYEGGDASLGKRGMHEGEGTEGGKKWEKTQEKIKKENKDRRRRQSVRLRYTGADAKKKINTEKDPGVRKMYQEQFDKKGYVGG
jgi:hypothetical protein